MNYASLVAAVKEYLETDETTFNTYIDQFIKSTEEDLYRKVQLPVARKNSTSTMTASNQYLSAPTDFLSVYEMAVINGTTHTNLIRKDVSYVREAYPDASTTGVPKYYAQFDHNTFLLGPTPGSNYGVELHYYYKPASIVSASTTWLGDNAENAMLWGTVMNGYVFLKGSPDLVQVYKGLYDEAVQNLSMLGEGLSMKDANRHGQRRIPA